VAVLGESRLEPPAAPEVANEAADVRRGSFGLADGGLCGRRHRRPVGIDDPRGVTEREGAVAESERRAHLRAVAGERVRAANPARPDELVGRDITVVGHNRLRVGPLDGHARPHLDTARGQFLGDGLLKRFGKRRCNRVGLFEQDDLRGRVGRTLGEFTRGLDARESSAADDRAAACLADRLERLADGRGVGESLQRRGVALDARQAVEGRLRAETERHNVVVKVAVGKRDGLAVPVDAGHAGAAVGRPRENLLEGNRKAVAEVGPANRPVDEVLDEVGLALVDQRDVGVGQ
jgi:hypothetical protein